MWRPFVVVFFFCIVALFPSCLLNLFTNNILSGYVCCSWMCLDAGDCFFRNFKPFGVSDSLGERILVFSVGNVNEFTLSMPRPSLESKNVARCDTLL